MQIDFKYWPVTGKAERMGCSRFTLLIIRHIFVTATEKVLVRARQPRESRWAASTLDRKHTAPLDRWLPNTLHASNSTFLIHESQYVAIS